MPLAKPSTVPRFASLGAWQISTYYSIGERVTNDGGKIYICDTAGTSAGAGGPTGTGANIVDGTTRWDYVAASAPAWVALTAYALGDRVLNGGNVYQCIRAGTSAAAGGPSGTTTDIVDDSVIWQYIAAATAVVVTPTASQMDTGWQPAQRPPAQYFNWFMFWIYRWALYLSDTSAVKRDLTALAETWTLNGPTGDESPAVDSTAAVTTRKLWLRLFIGTYAFRIYKLDEGIEFVINAVWDGGGAVWNYDSGTQASRIYLRRQYFEWTRYGGATGWADGAWITHMQVVQGLASTFATGLTAATGDVEASAGAVQGLYLKGLGAIPVDTVNAAGSGNGTSAMVASSTAMRGSVDVTVGAGVPAAGAVVAVAFAAALPSVPRAIMAWTGDGLAVDDWWISNAGSTVNGFTISKTTALPAGAATYRVQYLVVI